MRIWRRRKRKRFAPFDRAALPEVAPLTFEETFAEGLLVAESAGRMALKNRMQRPITPEQLDRIVQMIDDTAAEIEKS